MDTSRLMDAEELQHYLGITRNATYTLLHASDFPTVRIGSRIFAVRDKVDEWIENQMTSGGYER